MPLYALVGTDGPEGRARRPAHREAHLAMWRRLADEGRVRYAGPLLGTDGGPVGSLVLFEAPDPTAARAVADADPYAVHGVFERVELRETRAVLPEPV